MITRETFSLGVDNSFRIKYLEIINTAKSEDRSKGQVYYENHHIIPKSLGGSDEAYNMVLLTPEEHFKTHVLLPYFTEGSDYASMIYAWNMMSNRNGGSLDYKEFTFLKEEFSKIHSSLISKKMVGVVNAKNVNTGERKHLSKEEFDNNANWVGVTAGREYSAESKKKISENHADVSGKNNPNYGKTPSLATRKKMSESAKNRIIKPIGKCSCGKEYKYLKSLEDHQLTCSKKI